jgi:Xaa-Pro aminopeptidase
MDKIEAIREVQRGVEHAMSEVVHYLRTGSNPTSEEAHGIIDFVLAEHNCESPEGHIVAGGLQSADPHSRGSGLILQGTPIVIDIFPRSQQTGYYADMSRTVCIGPASQELIHMYEAVHEAQALAIGKLTPGVPCIEIQEAVELFFEERGFKTFGRGKEFAYSEGFVHGVGHGVGLSVHEAPRIGRKSADTLQEGDVVTIEPGLYYPHIGGVRLEDMLVVTAHGARNLTTFPIQLEI